MIKTTRYCDICGKEINRQFDSFYQLVLPTRDYKGNYILSETEQDVCKSCFRELYWKIGEIQHPNRKCPD